MSNTICTANCDRILELVIVGVVEVYAVYVPFLPEFYGLAAPGEGEAACQLATSLP